MPVSSVVAPVLTSLVVALTGAFDSAQLNPAVLFGNGEPGVFLDANDWGPTGTGGTGVVFQDLAGTPVTAMEQPVQLILDKSQGLVLGAELVSDPGFDDASKWTLNSGCTVSNGKCTFAGVVNNQGALAVSPGAIVVGALYRVVLTVSSFTGGGVKPYIGGAFGENITAVGTFTQYLRAGNANSLVMVLANSTTTAVVESVSFKLIAGNHAYVSASANRPTITARYNLLTKTEDYRTVWIGNGAVPSLAGVTPPAGASAVSLVTSSAGAGGHAIYENVSGGVAGVSYTLTWKIAQGTTTYACVGDQGDAVWRVLTVNLVTGAVTGQSNCTGTCVASTNGFWLVSCTFTRTNGGMIAPFVGAAISASNSIWPSYTAAGTETVYATAVDLRPSDQATGLIPTYQRVNTATDYDTVGFPVLIKGNGSNQYLTGNLDLRSTNKVTVWAGVRKFSDAAAAIFLETSIAVGSGNPGSFRVAAPEGVTHTYGFALQNSAATPGVTTPANFTAPITNVLSAVMGTQETAQNTAFLIRVNGQSQNVGSTGFSAGGNFGSYPFYIFSRAGTSLFMNGGFNTIIVLGAAANDAQFSMTESWCNARIKAWDQSALSYLLLQDGTSKLLLQDGSGRLLLGS